MNDIDKLEQTEGTKMNDIDKLEQMVEKANDATRRTRTQKLLRREVRTKNKIICVMFAVIIVLLTALVYSHCTYARLAAEYKDISAQADNMRAYITELENSLGGGK